MRTAVIAPMGLAVSVLIHLALLTAVAVPSHRRTSHGETVVVEIVPASEMPEVADAPQPAAEGPAPKSAHTKPADTQPDWSQLQMKPPQPAERADQPTRSAESSSAAPAQKRSAQSPQRQRTAATQAQTQPQQQPQQQQQQQPQQMSPAQMPAQPEPSQPGQAPQPPQQASEQPAAAPERSAEDVAAQADRLSAMLNLPSPGMAQYGSEAEVKANVSGDEVAAFKAHLKSCWTPPEDAPDDPKIFLILRVVLRQNGTLERPPEPIGGHPLGALLKNAAVNAVSRCQPFTMLSAAKYNEWRVLHLTFPPDRKG